MLVLTDISTWEPDDHESLIRLIVHADIFEIEGIVVSTGWSMDKVEQGLEIPLWMWSPEPSKWMNLK